MSGVRRYQRWCAGAVFTALCVFFVVPLSTHAMEHDMPVGEHALPDCGDSCAPRIPSASDACARHCFGVPSPESRLLHRAHGFDAPLIAVYATDVFQVVALAPDDRAPRDAGIDFRVSHLLSTQQRE